MHWCFFGAVATLKQPTLEVRPGVFPFNASQLTAISEGFRPDGQTQLSVTGLNWNSLAAEMSFQPCVWEVLVPLTVFIFLLRELRVATAKAVVRDVTIDPLFMQILHIGFVGEAGIGCHNRAGVDRCCRQYPAC